MRKWKNLLKFSMPIWKKWLKTDDKKIVQFWVVVKMEINEWQKSLEMLIKFERKINKCIRLSMDQKNISSLSLTYLWKLRLCKEITSILQTILSWTTSCKLNPVIECDRPILSMHNVPLDLFSLNPPPPLQDHYI